MVIIVNQNERNTVIGINLEIEKTSKCHEKLLTGRS